MGTEEHYIVDKRYVKDDPSKKTDFGWRFHGKTVLLHVDKSIVYDSSTSQMEEALREMSRQFSFLDTCLQCGMCTDWCPNSHVASERKFSPRELIQRLRLGLLDLSGEELWACTNCGGCTTKCLYEIPLIEVIISLRALVVEQGAGYIPATVKKAFSSVRAFMNPWMEEQGKRADWLAETGIQPSPSDGAILLFACCYPSYDLRARKIAQAAARLMYSLGIDFDILGEKEVCCGDSVMRVGDLDTFNRLKAINISNIESRGLRKVYTLSPHCAQVMKTGYFENHEERVSVKPFVLLLHDALHSGSLTFNKPVNKTVTFHDPCFLAKHADIVEEPREILRSIPGLSLVEMAHRGRDGLCCGGGGGGVWLDRKRGERLAEVRLEEALASGADTVVTACPYCLSMLEDSVKNDEKFSHIEVMDICELAFEAL